MHASFFPRVYALHQSEDSLRDAADALLSRVAALKKTPSSKVRLQCFPPSVVSSPELAAAAQANPTAAARLSPRAAAHLGSLLSLRGGVHLVGLQPCGDTPAVNQRLKKNNKGGKEKEKEEDVKDERKEDHRSRAYAKIAEAALRSDILREALDDDDDDVVVVDENADSPLRRRRRGQMMTALDVGAAPGGWTQYLAERGVAVTAIDPADVTMPSARGNHHDHRHRHLRMTAQTAWPFLAKELSAAAAAAAAHADGGGGEGVVGDSRPPYDVYVSDAVLHDVTGQETLLGGAVRAGLMRPGAALVITFKSIPGRGAGGYERAVRLQARRLARSWCDDGGEEDDDCEDEDDDGDEDKKKSRWELLHLFSNRRRERTFVGVLSAAAVARESSGVV